jgi:hypothetical protein
MVFEPGVRYNMLRFCFICIQKSFDVFFCFPSSVVFLLLEYIFTASVSQKALGPKNNNCYNLGSIQEKQADRVEYSSGSGSRTRREPRF